MTAPGRPVHCSPGDQQAIDGWMLDQKRRGLLASTVQDRRYRLKTWQRFLAPRSLLEATTDDVQLFIDSRGPAARTRYRWASDLHTLYDWATRNGLVRVDPTEGVIRPRLHRLLPRPIPDTDLSAALAHAERDLRCWLLLMAYAGLRCGEVAKLDRADVLDTIDPPSLLVHGKGAKPRIVPAHPEVLRALRALPMPRTGRVFHRSRGGALLSEHVSRRVANFFDSLGVDASAHQLRHWFGTNLYRATKDLRLVQDIMGHASPVTTAGYADYSKDDAACAIAGLAARPKKQIGHLAAVR